jgi:hypothetical protein
MNLFFFHNLHKEHDHIRLRTRGITVAKRSNLVGKIMVRFEYKYHTLEVWVFDFVQRDGKGGWRGIGGHTPVGCLSPTKHPSLDEQRAQLALSSPLQKEERGRER